MKILILCLIVSAPLFLFGQDCNCLVNFDSTVSKVKANYSGFSDKVKKNNVKDFNKFTAQLRKKAILASNTDSCYVILRTWTNYFKDHHLRVQLDWRYREKYPEVAKRLNKLFVVPNNVPRSEERLDPNTHIKELDANTLLIRLPSFEWSEKKLIDSLLIAYRKRLETSENLIIDIRGNSGGTDYVYSSLLPFLYTNPIIGKPDEYRSSKDNIQALEDNLKDNDLSAASKEFLSKLIILMKAKPNGYVNPSGKDSFEIKLDSVYEFPKKVAILIDRNSASSAETFLLTASQSKKVKLYGENSAGIIDYGSTQFFNIPCKELNLVIPIARSKRLPERPIDNIGIAPNVSIGSEEIDKVKIVHKMMR